MSKKSIGDFQTTTNITSNKVHNALSSHFFKTIHNQEQQKIDDNAKEVQDAIDNNSFYPDSGEDGNLNKGENQDHIN